MQRSPWSVLRKHRYSHTFSVILQYQNYRNVWKNWGFLKLDHQLLCAPGLRCSFFELVSYSFQRGGIKYINLRRKSWLWIPIQIFEFPAILPWLPMMQLWAWTSLLFVCFFPFIIFATRLPCWIGWRPSDSLIVLTFNFAKNASSKVPPAFHDESTRRSQNNRNRWSNRCIAVRYGYSVKIALAYFPQRVLQR